jgi:short-subunit dehydrogenase
MKTHVWITGASSGIGKAVALEMAARGYDLIISGRNQEALKQLACQTGAYVLAFDATDRQANLDAANDLNQRYGCIDIVFLNAGNCEYVDVDAFKSDVFERMIKTNFLSMVYGVEAALPLLRASKKPQLVGMSSAVAFLGLPRSEAYGASKAAIRNFLQGLRVSLSRENITVSIVYPGFVKTPLTNKNDFPMPMLISAEQAAKAIVAGIEKKKLDIYVPVLFLYLTRLISMLPSKISSHLLKLLLR